MAIGALLFEDECGPVEQTGGFVNRQLGFRLPLPAPTLVTKTWGLKPNGAARDCGSRFRGFDSLPSLQPLRGPVAQLGRAPVLHSGGREFDPRRVHQDLRRCTTRSVR